MAGPILTEPEILGKDPVSIFSINPVELTGWEFILAKYEPQDQPIILFEFVLIKQGNPLKKVCQKILIHQICPPRKSNNINNINPFKGSKDPL